MNKMAKKTHDLAKEPEVVDLRLDKFCDCPHLPLVVRMENYSVAYGMEAHNVYIIANKDDITFKAIPLL